MVIIKCLNCGKESEAQRPTKKWCSHLCYARYQSGYPKTRKCLECGQEFQVVTRGDDANRKYCSYRCSKLANGKKIRAWNGDHPEAMKTYNRNRVAKEPGAYKRQAREHRLKILELLGGRCCVCGVTNTNWLHVDYIPTMRGTGGRHSRHLKFVRENSEDFRILCANHHYELTITGTIEGTSIVQ